MPTSSPSHLRGLAEVAAASVLWGTGGLAVQLIRERDAALPGHHQRLADGDRRRGAAGRPPRCCAAAASSSTSPVPGHGSCWPSASAPPPTRGSTSSRSPRSAWPSRPWSASALAPVLLTAAEAVRHRRTPTRVAAGGPGRRTHRAGAGQRGRPRVRHRSRAGGRRAARARVGDDVRPHDRRRRLHQQAGLAARADERDDPGRSRHPGAVPRAGRRAARHRRPRRAGLAGLPRGAHDGAGLRPPLLRAPGGRTEHGRHGEPGGAGHRCRRRSGRAVGGARPRRGRRHPAGARRGRRARPGEHGAPARCCRTPGRADGYG